MKSESMLRVAAVGLAASLVAVGAAWALTNPVRVIEMRLDGSGGIVLDPSNPIVIQCKKINSQGFCVGGSKEKICWIVADEAWAAKIADGDMVRIRAKQNPVGPAAYENIRILDETKPAEGSKKGRGQFVIDGSKKCPAEDPPSIRSQGPYRPTWNENGEARWEYEIQALDSGGSLYASYDPQIIIVKAGGGFLGSLSGLLVAAVVGIGGLVVGSAATRYLARRSG